MLYKSKLREQLLQEWLEEIRADDELLDELKIMYEWGYKYDMLKQGMTANNEKRITNVLRQIHMRLNPIFKSIADKLINVFDSWLSKHAIDKPDLWAKARYDDNDGYEILNAIKYDYARYAYDDDGDFITFYEDSFKAIYTYYISDFNERLDEFVDDYRVQAEEDEENGDEDEAKEKNERADEIESLNMKDYDDVLTFMENYAYDSPKDFIDAHEEDEIMLTTIYEEVLFPVWFDHWKAEGIVQTRKNVMETFKSLKKVKGEKDFSKKMVILNMALNQVHQTGTFINDYINPMYSVNKNDLDKLSDVSNMDLKDWDAEIKRNL